jgi:hypothetical protein
LRYLFQHLPPFAADHSGVASTLHDLGGLVAIHDASGGTGSFTGYDEPRRFSRKSSVYRSGLREFDAIVGSFLAWDRSFADENDGFPTNAAKAMRHLAVRAARKENEKEAGKPREEERSRA